MSSIHVLIMALGFKVDELRHWVEGIYDETRAWGYAGNKGLHHGVSLNVVVDSFQNAN